MTVTLLVLNLLALFVVGFIQDILGGYYLRLVNEERILLATFISFIHSIIAWGIWLWFMYQFQHAAEAMNGIQAIFYSTGSAIGTYCGLKKPGAKR